MKPTREMTALELLETHCQALQADNDRLREVLSQIEDFARGEGDVGNIIARKAAAALRPDTAPPTHQPTGES